ncbi:MAG: hypothetical protein OXH32_18135 [Acidobacteria bacterium]|nr:hypothetical protein [Acidobacteriota bacterium]
MRHLLTAALSVLVFGLLTSLLLVPGSPVEASSSSQDRVEQLTETEMASIVGGGLLSHLDCTNIANRTGKVLQVVGFLYRDGITSGIGNFLRHVRCEF